MPAEKRESFKVKQEKQAGSVRSSKGGGQERFYLNQRGGGGLMESILFGADSTYGVKKKSQMEFSQRLGGN